MDCENKVGKSPYNPRSMLKLIICSRTNHVTSSEVIEDYELYHNVYKYDYYYITPSARSIRMFKKDYTKFIMIF